MIAVIFEWRNIEARRASQALGRKTIFADYRLNVAQIIRNYGMHDRKGAPGDSRQAHGD